MVRINEIRIIGQSWLGQWYARKYLQGRKCKVVGISHSKDGFQVLHPITQRKGYNVKFADCEFVS